MSNDPKKHAHIMRGCPGSGQSTIAERLRTIAAEPGIHSVYVSRDLVREALTGSASDHSAEQRVTNACAAMVERACESGEYIVIDNTHTEAWHMESAIAELERAGYDITIVTVHPPLEVCKARNADRERQVPEHVIDRMWQAIEASKDWTPENYQGGKVTLLKVGK